MKSTFALCYTVKNDKDLLLYSCLYHLKKGCSKIYIFDDGSTDGTIETVRNIPNIEIYKSIKPIINEKSPKWFESLIHRWEESFDVRKRMNTYKASKLALNENIKWIGSIDSDEAISTQFATGKDILEIINNVDNKYDQILLRNLEVVTQNEKVKNPFLECSYFYKRFTYTEKIHRILRALIYRTTKNGKIQAWFDYFFYKIRFKGALHNLFTHPTNKTKIPAGYYLGYNNYKSFIKTTEIENFIFNIHKWDKGSRKPKNYVTGNILHYDLYSPQSFINKFAQRPKNMFFKVFYLRYQLAMIALNSTEDQVIEFFKQNLVDKNPQESKIKNLIVKIDDVQNTLKENKR